jgi:hypothetical protein
MHDAASGNETVVGSVELDWRTAVGRVLPGDEELAVAVAAALDEPFAAVHPTVLTGALARGAPATSRDLESVIDAERARMRASGARRPSPRRIHAETFEELLDKTRRMSADGSLDLAAVVEIQRESGAIAARSDLRLVLFLARYAVIRRVIWECCLAAVRDGRLEATALGELGRWIFLLNEVTSLAVTDGYRTAEREILARDAQARRGALEEILGVVASDTMTTARLRRMATRFGLSPDRAYRVVVIAPRPEADPTPDRTGIDQDDLELLAGRIGHLAGSTAPGAEGAGAGIRLPAVLPMRGRIVILANADWAGFGRIAAVLDKVLGGPGASRQAARPASAWVAVGSPAVDGVAQLARVLADLVDATRTADLIGRRGWVPDPGSLAVERLLLESRELGDAAVEHELGALLADERLGSELVETLQVYFDSGENMREAARRLHLANRTVAYRLEKIEALLGGPLDDASRRRLAVALLVRRLRSGSD